MDLIEDEVIATTRCPHPACNAPPRHACKAVGRFYERTHVHRGRWMKAERDRRVPGRVVYPPE